ncbi:hypothetical protein [Stakelama marina]
MRMIVRSCLLAGLLAATGLVAPDANAQHRRSDQSAALEARRAGRILPLREIERRVVPHMPNSQYLGFDFDSATGIYTLKFLRDGEVIWVDVDGRSGRIIRRTDR